MLSMAYHIRDHGYLLMMAAYQADQAYQENPAQTVLVAEVAEVEVEVMEVMEEMMVQTAQTAQVVVVRPISLMHQIPELLGVEAEVEEAEVVVEAARRRRVRKASIDVLFCMP